MRFSCNGDTTIKCFLFRQMSQYHTDLGLMVTRLDRAEAAGPLICCWHQLQDTLNGPKTKRAAARGDSQPADASWRVFSLFSFQ